MIIIPTIGNGGAEKVANLIANEMCNRGHVVSVLCLESSGDYECSLNERILVQTTGFRPQRGSKIKAYTSFIRGYIYVRKYVLKTVGEYEPDCIISFLPKADFMTFVAKRKYRFCWIVSERSDPWERGMLQQRVLESIYKKSCYLVCQTDSVRKYYLRKGIKNTRVIPNPVVIPKADGNRRIREKYGSFAIAVGRLDRVKNYPLMFSAFMQAVKECKSDFKLIVLGNGPKYYELIKLINELHADERIKLLGRMANVMDYLFNASFFISSSIYEGQSNALMEAMSARLPVICTDVRTGSARELVSDNNGILVPVNNEKEMIIAIKKMLNLDENSKEKMGRNSRAVIQRMNPVEIMETWAKLMERNYGEK